MTLIIYDATFLKNHTIDTGTKVEEKPMMAMMVVVARGKIA